MTIDCRSIDTFIDEEIDDYWFLVRIELCGAVAAVHNRRGKLKAR